MWRRAVASTAAVAGRRSPAASVREDLICFAGPAILSRQLASAPLPPEQASS